MSYILPSTSPFVSIKLTSKGRSMLSQGQLNFAYFGIGDSEINYNREELVNANPTDSILSATSKVFRTFDLQPNIKSFITTQNGPTLNALAAANINVVKATVNNEATERGGFINNGDGTYSSQTGNTYTSGVTIVSNSNIVGGSSLTIPNTFLATVGDFIRFKFLTNVTYASNATENSIPTTNLWYKIQSIQYVGGNIILTFDRQLPKFSIYSGNSYMYQYPNGEVANTFGYSTSTAYWDSGTLSFDSASNITCSDVKVWNMNNVFTENLAGITGLSTTNLYENYTKFGSYGYAGTKNPYLEYPLITSASTSGQINCNGIGYSYADTINKSISILHYSNNTISNLYGEYFYIDTTNSKYLNIVIPDLMYHNIGYHTALGITMGMSFISSGATQYIGKSDIYYVPLIENPSYLSGGTTPLVIGKVFPQLKIVVIDDDEIVAALSYKSNRNWTLPALSATLVNPTGATGILGVDQTMYLTYALDNMSGSGFTPTLPCQSYIKITNSTPTAKDVQFNIANKNLLPYMRKIESNYDGLGFYATNFRLVYQVVSNPNIRPDAGSWNAYDFTSRSLTTVTGQTIDPKLLENQIPLANNFILTAAIGSASTIYDITQSLSMAPNTNGNILQFGDERFFYGNLSTYIGADIYKTIFDLNINAAQFNQTSNPTYPSTNPPPIEITEVGIYDNNQNMVITGKLSQPVQLSSNDTITLELSLDF